MVTQIALLLLILIFPHPEIVHPEDMTGDWVARQMSERDTGSDSRLEMEMELVDSRGRRTERELFMVQRDFDGESKMLIRFTRPEDIRGTSFLVWEHADSEDERFIYLPALGRTRRITSAEKTDSFAGTDFTYEDISGREYNDFTYKLLGDTTLATGEKCYILESKPDEIKSDYAEIISLVDQESFLPLRVDYIDSRGKTFKRFDLKRKEKIEGIWTMMEMTMEDLENNHSTNIIITEIRYNQGIDSGNFSRRELEKGAP